MKRKGQTRIFEFFESRFVRVNPISSAVRSVRSYDEITLIDFDDSKTDFVLSFSDGTKEFYSAPNAREIVSFLRSKI